MTAEPSISTRFPPLAGSSTGTRPLARLYVWGGGREILRLCEPFGRFTGCERSTCDSRHSRGRRSSRKIGKAGRMRARRTWRNTYELALDSSSDQICMQIVGSKTSWRSVQHAGGVRRGCWRTNSTRSGRTVMESAQGENEHQTVNRLDRMLQENESCQAAEAMKAGVGF